MPAAWRLVPRGKKRSPAKKKRLDALQRKAKARHKHRKDVEQQHRTGKAL